MRNNNAAVIRKIIRRALAADKKRNFFVAAAIALTTLLLTSSFSIGISFLKSMQLQKVRFAASKVHATISSPTDEQLEQLKKLSYVQHVGVGTWVADVDGDAGIRQISLIHIDDTQWKYFNSPAFSDIVGKLPQQEDEIMLSRWALKLLGITEPELDMPLELSYQTALHYEPEQEITSDTRVFTLSGWFTTYYYIHSGGLDYALVSKDLADACGKTAAQMGTANLLFKDSRNIAESMRRLEADIPLMSHQRLDASPAYILDSQTLINTAIALVALAAFFVLTGCLLIYNVLSLSISRDIRFYGLMKTIGATPRQTRRLVMGQVFSLCAIGIPAGLLLAAGFSYSIIPAIMAASNMPAGNVVSFSPLVYGGAIACALLTAWLGARRPAQVAARIAPVEAVKYAKGSDIRLRARPGSMALRNILREGKRAFWVFCSLFLGMTVFLVVTAFVMSINTDRYAEEMLPCDVLLQNQATVYHIEDPVISDALLDTVASLPGVKHMSVLTSAYAGKVNSLDANGAALAIDINSGYMTEIWGVNRDAIEAYSQQLAQPLDVDAFMRGEFALASAPLPALYADVHTLHANDILMARSANTSVTIPLGGFMPQGVLTDRYSEGFELFVSADYLKSITGVSEVQQVRLTVDDSQEKETSLLLREILEGTSGIGMQSRYEIKQTMRDNITLMYVLGSGVALVLGLIGVLNFVNIMSMGVLARKRELAILESVGMTHKQVRRMLLLEGLGYAAISLALVMLLGNLAVWGLFSLLDGAWEYIVPRYPALPMAGMAAIIVLICSATPLRVYHLASKATLVERLREAE